MAGKIKRMHLNAYTSACVYESSSSCVCVSASVRIKATEWRKKKKEMQRMPIYMPTFGGG